MNDSAFVKCAQIVLRVGLGTAFLSASADRFGLWGPNGAPGVSWGDWSHFMVYASKLNWFTPAPLVPIAAGIATAAEVVFGIALLTGIYLRWAALGSAALLGIFFIAMAGASGIKAPLDYSVLSGLGGAFLLAALNPPPEAKLNQ